MQSPAAPLQAEFEKQASAPERVFEFDSVDESSEVLGWVDIKRKAGKITSGNITLTLQNTDKAWNGILSAPENKFLKDGEIKIGYTAHGFMTLFKGKLEDAQFKTKNTVAMTFRDKLSYFTTVPIGSQESPADYYSASSYTVFGDDDWSAGRNPTHLIWHILTVHGGLDNTEGAGNTDIDWTSFTECKNLLDAMGYKVQGNIEGQTINEILKNIFEMFGIAVYSEYEGKIVCKFWLGQDNASVQTYTDTKWKAMPILKTKRLEVINRYSISYGYNPATEAWGGIHTENDNVSQGKYGIFTKLFQNIAIWYYDQPSAQAFAERMIIETAEPPQEVEFTSFLFAYRQQLYDALKLTISEYDWTNQGFRIESLSFKIKDGTIRIKGHKTTLYDFLILDDPVRGKLDDVNVLA